MEGSSLGLSGIFSALGDLLGDFLGLLDGFSLGFSDGHSFWLSDFHLGSYLRLRDPHWARPSGYCKVFSLDPLLGSWVLGRIFTQDTRSGIIFHLVSCSSLGMIFNQVLA
jgi:hypothetical protein